MNALRLGIARVGANRGFPSREHIQKVANIMSSALRIALGADGVSIWSSDIFGSAEPSRLRDFISRAFAVEEVDAVELRPARSFGRIRHAAAANPAQILKKLSRALSAPGSGAVNGHPASIDVGIVYLDGPHASPIRISRIGDVLSTWRVRRKRAGELRLSHPVLRNRRDVVFRLEEELAALLGVTHFRASAVTAGVSIRFDERTTTAERLVLELEKAWPRLLQGLEAPPSQKRLVASAGLVGLAYTGQYVVPALRPVALVGVTLYSFPNVVNAARQLTRGEVGIAAMYSTGLAFMLVSGLPFTASVMSALMQFWPHLARRRVVNSQRRLFAGQRRLPAWVRVRQADGSEVEVHVANLQKDAIAVVRRGELLGVDGVVEDGAAAVLEEVAFGGSHVEDKAPGDTVAAGTLVRDGTLTIRVERAGTQTSAGYVASLLPHATIAGLPASLEAERVANRNAKPALALAALALLLTRTRHPAQAVIRPDYATAPRLSAQLSTLHGIAHGFQAGVVFRNPAALDRLSAAEVYVFDDSAGLDLPRVEIAAVQSVKNVSAELVVGYALDAHRGSRGEQRSALEAFATKRHAEHPTPGTVHRYAGVARYHDAAGSTIEVATSRYLAASKIEVPQFATRLVRRRVADDVDTALTNDQPSLRPLWVLRDGQVIGVISFTRTGDIVGRQVIAALAARSNRGRKPVRVVYLARGGQADAQALAHDLGLEFHGGLSGAAKGELIRGLGRAVLWIGDGSDPDAREALAASTVSVSLAPLLRSREDGADILLPHRGLSGLPMLLDLAGAHASRLEQAYRTVYASNMLGVAASFLATFSPLQVGLLSNLGTGIVYARHAMALGRLEHAAESRRKRLASV
jgi:cation-transporting P-type ATPase C